MKIRLTLFGWEVFCFEIGRAVEDAPVLAFGAGETHNFERDLTPYTPEDRYDWGEWSFGFGQPKNE